MGVCLDDNWAEQGQVKFQLNFNFYDQNDQNTVQIWDYINVCIPEGHNWKGKYIPCHPLGKS